MFYILLLTKALKSCVYFILMENLSLLVTFQMLNSLMWLVSTMVDSTILESRIHLLCLFYKKRNTVSSVENSYRFPLDFLETTLAPEDLTCFFPKSCLGCSACFKQAGLPDSGGILLSCVYCPNMP